MSVARSSDYAARPQHFLYFLPEPQGQWLLRPVFRLNHRQPDSEENSFERMA